MAIGPFTITLLREQVIDFTVPFSEGSTGIMTLSPGYEANKSLFQTLKPYSVQVWLSIVAAIVIVGCMSLLVNRFTPFGRKTEDRPLQAKYETSLRDNLWMVYSSVTEQGIQHSPEAVSGRCLIGFWWLFTILLVATYTANLAAFLTISLPPPPINTLGELLAQDKIQPIVQAGTSFETMFRNSHSDLYKRTWSRLQNSPKISHEASILDLVKAGQYAYISDRPVLDYLAGQECRTYSVAEESFDVVGYGMVLPQDAAYGKIINRLIVRMQEAGLMEKWRHHWWSSNSSCRESPQTLQSHLDLDSLGGLFLLSLTHQRYKAVLYREGYPVHPAPCCRSFKIGYFVVGGEPHQLCPGSQRCADVVNTQRKPDPIVLEAQTLKPNQE
ncbi:glutamate receptor 3-like [Liolophura sinensis]|uniref:glutamate receptor 3-like n=1 Tax=Liolophura sinensis TaxID=3198878 RepID=UPI0031598578